ncbi:MAG: substrate-binding domain-containing protein [Treponema sp.]|nr:substrate-binding domain-containing protein [Treponema sp.]
MEKKKQRLIKWVLLILTLIALLVFMFLFYTTFRQARAIIKTQNEYNPADTCLYHIIITGTYENQSFLTELYKGAASLEQSYNAVVDLHVPDSQAGTASLQDLIDYCSFLNADGIIAYIDSPDDTPLLLQRNDEPLIPFITTGQFSPNLEQISYVGVNYWEMGKRVADEITSLIPQGGNVYIISDSISTNTTNLISSVQRTLQDSPQIHFSVIEEIPQSFTLESNSNIFISLAEDDTIMSAQQLSELFPAYSYKLLGFGGNEVCQLYLQKGFITELFSLDPERIGKAAIQELFEYRNRGYANSYVTAEVKITRAEK